MDPTYAPAVAKRRRPPFDPFAGMRRSPDRRPGSFNDQADARPDPNVEFVGYQASAVGGGPLDWFVDLFRAKHRLRRNRVDGTGDDRQP